MPLQLVLPLRSSFGSLKDRLRSDHTTNRFACYSTKATIILSDMSAVEHGPFACIPGSHKVRLASRFLLHSF